MKTLLIIDANLGQARAYMAKTLLGAAARKAKLEIIDNPNDAEMAIVLGDSIPNDSALNGKNVWLGDISRAVAHPELFLSEAKGHAKPYTAPVTATAPVAASSMVAAVAMSSCGSENTSPQTTSAPTASTSVSPAGRAFSSTFRRKFPCIRSLFGSSAKRKPGMPMVNALISEICDGSSG